MPPCFWLISHKDMGNWVVAEYQVQVKGEDRVAVNSKGGSLMPRSVD